MPASFSRPKGVRTRNSYEWLYQDAGAGSGSLGQMAGHDSQIILVNTDQSQWLFVYTINCVSNFITNLYYFTVQGIPAGATFQNGTFPVVCDGAPPPAQLFGAYVATPPGNLPFPFMSPLNFNSNIPGVNPLAIVKPGYSLVTQGTGDQITSFGFIVAGP